MSATWEGRQRSGPAGDKEKFEWAGERDKEKFESAGERDKAAVICRCRAWSKIFRVTKIGSLQHRKFSSRTTITDEITGCVSYF